MRISSHRGTENTEENFCQDLQDLSDCLVLNSNPAHPVKKKRVFVGETLFDTGKRTARHAGIN